MTAGDRPLAGPVRRAPAVKSREPRMIGPDSSLLQMLSDPDEGPFLRELIAQPRGAGALLGSAPYLEAPGERRGDSPRLEFLPSGGGPGVEVTPARQARHREL